MLIKKALRARTLIALVASIGCWIGPATGQFSDKPQDQVNPIPPPKPSEPRPVDASEYQSIVAESDAAWGLPPEMLSALESKAGTYQDYTRRFTCDETARLAKYDEGGQVSDEKVRNYAYLLLRGEGVETLQELRQLTTKDGGIKPGAVDDEEPFPAAYQWVFLFSRFNQSYFAYRHVRTEFDGFDLVHEIQFRGSLPFTNGKDIRQWEGTVLIDAFLYTPIEIHAEPAGQKDRIDQLYRNWAKSFNVMGFRSAKKPMGYRAQLQFRLRKDEMTFPTEVRYDTQRAVGPTQLVPVHASIRSYDRYVFTRILAVPAVGEAVSP